MDGGGISKSNIEAEVVEKEGIQGEIVKTKVHLRGNREIQ